MLLLPQQVKTTQLLKGCCRCLTTEVSLQINMSNCTDRSNTSLEKIVKKKDRKERMKRKKEGRKEGGLSETSRRKGGKCKVPYKVCLCRFEQRAFFGMRKC